MKPLFFALLTIGLLIVKSTPAIAASERFMFVVDGSGSMWGQIDGVAKIVTAREVMSTLIDDLNDSVEVGLVSYGHRQKGECGDIETLIPLGPLDRTAIKSAVNNISPKGKTPLSAAVVKAAEELRYTEERATVILVSDGRETCDMDPCAIGNELEQTGVEFTTHVIGFDVAEAADRAQLQCLAENTGGMFLSASNAEELTVALKQIAAVVIAPPVEEAEPVQTFTALVNDTAVSGDAEWTFINKNTEEVTVENGDASNFPINLSSGTYDVFFRQGEINGSEQLEITEEVNGNFSIAVADIIATLDAASEASLGQSIAVKWEGPNASKDYIEIGNPGEAGYINWAYTATGNPVSLLMPNEPGDYEIRYVLGQGKRVLATQAITVTDITVTLDAASEASLGQSIAVNWQGPNTSKDYIEIGKPG